VTIILYSRNKAKQYANSYDVGFVFEALWKKRNFDSEGNRVSSHSCPLVAIPDTVLYRSGFPAQWYFQSKQEHGKLLRKKPNSLTISTIFDTFGAWNGSCETEVVACFVGTTGKEPSKQINNIVFFDRTRLKDFVYGENMMREGFLQRFVAPASIPFDSSATNVTLHVSWSQYKCVVEQRVNKMKLDNKHYKTADKVNLSATRVDTIPVGCLTRLHQTINEHCNAIADHIKATTFDRTEITTMTCYFKIGDKNSLYLLFVSSVTVAPKYQDNFGFITSLRTFVGRCSPDLHCPDFFGLVDRKLKEAADHELQGNCALCSISSEEDPQARSFAVTYKMLAEYTERDRNKVLEALKSVSLPTIDMSQLADKSGARKEEAVKVSAKAAALFSLLDTQGIGKLSRMDLWAGLLDYGYTQTEIAQILGIGADDNVREDLKTFIEADDHEKAAEDTGNDEIRPYTPDFDNDAQDLSFGCVDESGNIDDEEFKAYLEVGKGEALQYGASLVRFSGAVLHFKGESKPYASINGDYQRSSEICNRRAVYTHMSNTFAMWWAKAHGKLCWCVGKKDAVGTDAMVAYVESMGLGPEEERKRPWSVYSYTSDSWEMQSGIEVSSLDRSVKNEKDEEGLHEQSYDSKLSTIAQSENNDAVAQKNAVEDEDERTQEVSERKEVAHAKDLPASVRNEQISLGDFIKGVEAAVRSMDQKRKARFVLNVDMVGYAGQETTVKMKAIESDDLYQGILDEEPGENVGGEYVDQLGVGGKGGNNILVNVDFAREAIDRSRARQLSKKLPKLLANLRQVLPPSHVKRIISLDSITSMSEEFGQLRIWCCKKCSMKFNITAREVFEWSDGRAQKKHAAKVQKKLATLRLLKEEAPRSRHTYPVGELPALCTPRMYQALHDHTSRAFVVGPPQLTSGGVKDIIGEVLRTRVKTDFRRTKLPQLDKLPVERPATDTKHDSDMSDLMDRLGLTPRRVVKGIHVEYKFGLYIFLMHMKTQI
jgi:hypothetical protein